MKRREPIGNGWIWLVYLLIYAVMVPWYLPTGSPGRIVLGFPHWALMSLLASLALAAWTAFVIARFWRLEE